MTSVKKHQRMGTVISVLMAVVLLLGTLGYTSTASAAGSFTPRTTAPTRSNKYYYSSMNAFYACGYGMPNCTAYAWGRAYEILGTRPKLCTSSAHKWWDYNKNGGYYEYGSQPKLGAIACWTRGVSGHVAVVEAINGNQVTISESHLTHGNFDTKTLTIGSESSYAGRFQGYIYILGDITLTFADYLAEHGYIPGNYTVDTGGYDLRVRQIADSNGAQLTVIPDAEEIYIEEINGNWGKVTYKGVTGWVLLPYCGNFRGLVNVDDIWYYFNNGRVDTDTTSIIKNANGWFYVNNGKVDFDYNGFAENENGTFLITNGQAELADEGLYDINGEQCYVSNGKVQDTTGLTKIGEFYYYLENGKLQEAFSGLATNDLGTWVVENGKVNFNYTGLFNSGNQNYNVVASKVISEAE